MTLEELYPLTDDLIVEGDGAGYCSQFIIPYNATPDATADPTLPMFAGSDRNRRPFPENIPIRSFAPGSEWLYFKLYCGPSVADEILQQVVIPVARQALATKAATHWFFIRYGDPQWHLRFRLAGVPERLISEVVPLLTQASQAHFQRGTIARIQLDTYDRELRRYGGLVGTECSEQFFFADSEAVGAALSSVNGDEGIEARWLLAVQGVNAILDDFGFDVEAKLAALAAPAESMFLEFGGHDYLAKALGDKYRKMRMLVKAGLAKGDEIGEVLRQAGVGEKRGAILGEALQAGQAIFEKRGRAWSGAAASLRESRTAGDLPLSLGRLAASFSHMHANRMFRAEARAHELLLYNFLSREYASAIARRKNRS